MWLLPALPVVSRLATGTYYKLSFVGESVPSRGPVLLVGNHPNSLLDPAVLAGTTLRLASGRLASARCRLHPGVSPAR